MKAQWHMALLYASIGVSVVGISSWYRTGNPFHSFVFAVATALAMGILGFAVGHIVGNPQGKTRPNTPVFLQELMHSPFEKSKRQGRMPEQEPPSPAPEEMKKSNAPLTGEETFVDDLK